MIRRLWMLAAVCALLGVGPVYADTSGIQWTPGPVYQSPDGKFVFKTRGRAYFDNAWISDSDGGVDISGTEFRTARFGFEAEVGDHLGIRFALDFAHKTVTFKDIYMSWTEGNTTFKGGHFRLGSSLENGSSSRFGWFMERGAYIEAFGFGRQFGIAVEQRFENASIVAGLFKGGFAKNGEDQSLQLFTHATKSFPIDGGYIHTGFSLRYRKKGQNQTGYSYRDRPGQHLAPRFVDTSSIADSDLFFGIDAGFIKGPFSLAGELGFAKAKLIAPLPGQGDPTFGGGTITIGYYFTGEDTPYDPVYGVLGRPAVKDPVFKGGPGAWQGVVRFDVLDLSDQGIFGGHQKSTTFGINWWLTSHLKTTLNYTHAWVTGAVLVPVNGLDGANRIDSIGVRTQIDW